LRWEKEFIKKMTNNYDALQYIAPIFEGGAFQDHEERSFISTELEDLQNIAKAHRNKPLVINHKDITNPNEIYGYVADTWVNTEGFTDDNGIFHKADFAIWAKALIIKDQAYIKKLFEEKEHAFSNQYTVIGDELGFEKNGVKYDRLIKSIQVDNVAIVENPRYTITKKIFKNSLDNKKKCDKLNNCVESNISNKIMTNATNSKINSLKSFAKKIFVNAEEGLNKETEGKVLHVKKNQAFVKLNETTEVDSKDFFDVVKNALRKTNEDKKEYLNENTTYDIEGQKMTLNEMKEIYKNAIKANEEDVKENEEGEEEGEKEIKENEVGEDVKENENEPEESEDKKENEEGEDKDVVTLIFEEEDGEEQDNACKNSDEEAIKKENKKSNSVAKPVVKKNTAEVKASKEQFLNYVNQVELETVKKFKNDDSLEFNQVLTL
jgi:hypothetical protein